MPRGIGRKTPNLSMASSKTSWDDLDEDSDAATSLCVQMRAHVSEMARKEGVSAMVITWPVNKHFTPLCVDPSVVVKARQLQDVTWHDVPARRWRLLTQEEQSNLKKDVWHYSRTDVKEHVARAAGALAEEIREERANFTQAFGVSFAFDLGPEGLPGEGEVKEWLAGRVKMSLYDWVSLNRKELQARARAKTSAAAR